MHKADHVVVRVENHTPLVWRLLYVWDWIWTRVMRRKLKVRARHLPRPCDVTLNGEPGRVSQVAWYDTGPVVLSLDDPGHGTTVDYLVADEVDTWPAQMRGDSNPDPLRKLATFSSGQLPDLFERAEELAKEAKENQRAAFAKLRPPDDESKGNE